MTYLKFVGSSALRVVLAILGILGIAVLTGFVDVGNAIIQIFGFSGLIVICGRVFVPLFDGAPAQGKLRWLLGPGSFAATAFKVATYAALPIAIFAIILSLVADGVSSTLDEHGGWPALLVAAAVLLLVCLVVSLLLRLFAVPVAFVFRRALHRLRSRNVGGTSPPVVIGPSIAGRWDSSEGSLVLLCVLAIAFAVILGFADAGEHPTRRDATTGKRITMGSPTKSLAKASDTDILKGLAPALDVSEREGWYPQRVNAYLSESVVLGKGSKVLVRHPTVSDLATACGESATTPCALRDARCPHSPACRPRRIVGAEGEIITNDDIVTYGRVIRRSPSAYEGTVPATLKEALRTESSKISWGASPFGAKLTGIVQYWIFAPFDKFSTDLGVFLGNVEQWHAADWETITIGMSDNDVLFIALSSHCGGAWQQYRNAVSLHAADAAWDPLGSGLHAVVGYADGTHGMYFEPTSNRSPDSLGCVKHRISHLLSPLLYAANVRDVTSSYLTILPIPISGDESRSVLTFRGAWSIKEEKARIELVSHVIVDKKGGSIVKPSGPSAPVTKDLYTDPVKEIFCTREYANASSLSGHGNCDQALRKKRQKEAS